MTPKMQETVETIWNQIEPFDAVSREHILSQVEKKSKAKAKPPGERKFRITDLLGAGVGVWTDPNADSETRRKQIDDFIRGERESWEQ